MSSTDDATAELKPFLLLAKSAKGAAAASLISQVLEHPSVFVFGELLDVSGVKDLAGSPSAGSLELLRIFAYGTWSDYKERQAQLPALNEAQAAKLKKLTVVALAAQTKVLEYDVLMRGVELRGVRELEDLIIECIYTGLLQGRLDQQVRFVFCCLLAALTSLLRTHRLVVCACLSISRRPTSRSSPAPAATSAPTRSRAYRRPF